MDRRGWLARFPSGYASHTAPISLNQSILELHALDARSTALRYPLTRGAQRHGLAGAPRQVDLPHFKAVMTQIAAFLEGCLTMIDEAAQGHFEL